MIEVGLVDGLFEMFKIREEIKKPKSEIIAESIISSYNHKFGKFLLGTHLNFRASVIEKVFLPKKKKMDLQRKLKLPELLMNF